MRWLVLLLVVAISFPAAAQDDQKFEELIQRSLTLENPDPAKREEVEKTVSDRLVGNARTV